ncbi:MAG: DUF4384 domain-containing protein [Gemmatimonadales bacterium]
MLFALGLLAGLTGPAIPPRPAIAATRSAPIPLYRIIGEARPKISVWTNSTDPYQRGDRVRVYVSAETDAYVTVLRVDTDGRVRVLYPVEPWQDNFVRGGRTFEVIGRDDDNAFDVDDNPGVGYVFAVASADSFAYTGFIRGDHWDYRTIADGRVSGDPYVALTDFASKITAQGDWDYDITPYYVEKHYDYPRFVCYDCHAYASYSAWDPYSSYCPRFRIVIYNDPYYYPYYYGGRRVAVVRPFRPEARFVFKDYNGNVGGGGYVTVLDRRPVRPTGNGSTIVVPDRGRTGADIGGRGSIPTPQGFIAGRRPDRNGGGVSGQGVQPDIGGTGTMRRPTGNGGQPQPDPNGGRRIEPNQPPPHANPQPDPNGGRRVEPNQPPPHANPQPDPNGGRRVEPNRPPERRPEPQPRAEPRREPPHANPQPERRGGGGGHQPELRRRRP